MCISLREDRIQNSTIDTTTAKERFKKGYWSNSDKLLNPAPTQSKASSKMTLTR
jgi:hypothetical protein